MSDLPDLPEELRPLFTRLSDTWAFQGRHFVGTRGCRGARKLAAGIDLVVRPGGLPVAGEDQ